MGPLLLQPWAPVCHPAERSCLGRKGTSCRLPREAGRVRVCGTRTGADRLHVSCSPPPLLLEKLGWMCAWDSSCHRLRVPPPPAPSDPSPSGAPEGRGWTQPPVLLRLTGYGHSHDPSGFPGLRMERMVLALFENPPTIRLNPTHLFAKKPRLTLNRASLSTRVPTDTSAPRMGHASRAGGTCRTAE